MCTASLAFPTLVPDTDGDPTNNSTIRSIGGNDLETFDAKLKHLIKFAEKRKGKWVYRFASHPRFGYWAYNILHRKQLLSQGNFYIKQNFGEKLMSIEELKDMLQNNSYSQMISKIQYYAKQISGTNLHWYQVEEQLKATLNQVGSPSIFWNLLCAEFHWPEFHKMFG